MFRTPLAIGAAIAALACASICFGKNEYLIAWQAEYPGSTLPDRMTDLLGAACYTCHHPAQFSNDGNCYREALKALLDGGMEIEDAIVAIDGEDSDGDGVPNGVEIMTVRADDPMQVGYNPGLVGDLGTDPCGVPPGQEITGMSETPTIICNGDTNGDGVVDIDDIVNVVLDFGGIGDANGDGNNGEVNGTDPVDIDDIVFVVLNFGNSCP